MAASHTQRDRAIRLVRQDWRAALTLAHEITDPWHRCQALAWVARFAPADAFARIADEAISAARACGDPYKIVAASAWPLRAMIERNQTNRVDDILAGLLQTATRIGHPVSRLDALFLLWQAIFPLGLGARRSVQESLVQACTVAESWKVSRTLCAMALILGPEDRPEAERMVALMRESNYRRQAARGLAAGCWESPRPFFWDETPV